MTEGSEDLEEDLEEEAEPVHQGSPYLESLGRVDHLALSQLGHCFGLSEQRRLIDWAFCSFVNCDSFLSLFTHSKLPSANQNQTQHLFVSIVFLVFSAMLLSTKPRARVGLRTTTRCGGE